MAGGFCRVAAEKENRFQQPLYQKIGRRYKLRVPGSGCGWESDGRLEIGIRGAVADLFSKAVFRGVVVGGVGVVGAELEAISRTS